MKQHWVIVAVLVILLINGGVFWYLNEMKETEERTEQKVTESQVSSSTTRAASGNAKESLGDLGDENLIAQEPTLDKENREVASISDESTAVEPTEEVAKTVSKDRDLIVIAAPSVNNSYYRDNFQNIIDFDIAYAQAVLPHDDIRIIVDAATRPYFVGKVDESILVTGDLEDIWLRDFSTVNPNNPVQFLYTSAAYGDDDEFADIVQDSFNDLVTGSGFRKTNYYIDGGNIVDNGVGRIVTTERFLDDNDLEYEDGVAELKRVFGAKEVAIIPADDPVLAHADGMVSFIEPNVIVVNRYDEPFRSDVIGELEYAFPDIKIIEVRTGAAGNKYDEDIESACGINVNSVVTRNTIYVPHFGDAQSDAYVAAIRPYTNKEIVTIDATGVCSMGGSVRCLAWQLHDDQAKKVLDILDK